jgi:hypothetical protein
VIIFTIGFGKFYDENLRNRKIVTMRMWQNGRKSSISYDREFGEKYDGNLALYSLVVTVDSVTSS